MWWSSDDLKELREPIGIYHAFFDFDSEQPR